MGTKNRTKMRDSGIELLRIILMLQVIFLHVCDYGKYTKIAVHAGGSLEFIYKFLWLSSRCPVYAYILIFGYFSVTSCKTIGSLKPKVLKMYLPMYFYSLLIPFIGQSLSLWELTDVDKKRAFFPLTSKIWYFMTLYMLVLILSPFLNRCLTNLTRGEYTFLIIVLFLIFSVWDLFAHLPDTSKVILTDKVFAMKEGKSLYGFIYMYILGGYFRLHVKPHGGAKCRYLIAYFAMTFINMLLWNNFEDYAKVVYFNSNPFSIIQGVCLLLFFRELTFKSRAINHIASLNLGVYMIHEQYLAREYIWNKIFNFREKWVYASTYKYLAKIVIACVAVFAVCALIEQLRVYVFAAIKMLYQKIKPKKAGSSA